MEKPGIGVGISGIAGFVPDDVRANSWWTEASLEAHRSRVQEDIVAGIDERARAESVDVDPAIVRHVTRFETDRFRGAKERRVASSSDEPSDLEARAVVRALASAQLDPQELDLLAVSSMLPDNPIPLNHALVAHKSGMRHDVTAFTLDTSCASFVTQLSTVAQLVASGEYRHAAIVQSSVISRITDYSLPASLNIGDGAMAAIISRVGEGRGYITSYHETHGELHLGLRLVARNSPQVPWYSGNIHQSQLTCVPVDTKANESVGSKATSLCRATCMRVLERAGLEIADVDFLALSQPTAWFCEAACEALGLPTDRTLSTFSKYGHLMAASAPMNLWTAYETGRLRPGDLVLVYSPGPGFIQAALLFRWSLPRRR